VYRYIGI
jgi:H+/gluconate symporter-like permease